MKRCTLALLVALTGCADSEDSPAPGFVWEQIAPEGGFVSSVAFHPSQPGEIWISGDDGSGLFRSVDGGRPGNYWAAPLRTRLPIV